MGEVVTISIAVFVLMGAAAITSIVVGFSNDYLFTQISGISLAVLAVGGPIAIISYFS